MLVAKTETNKSKSRRDGTENVIFDVIPTGFWGKHLIFATDMLSLWDKFVQKLFSLVFKPNFWTIIVFYELKL